jgi:hypothetical protein
VWIRGGFSRGFEEFLNAEGAKVSLRTQKEGKKKFKKKSNGFLNDLFQIFVFVLSSCVLSETFAPRAFKNS